MLRRLTRNEESTQATKLIILKTEVSTLLKEKKKILISQLRSKERGLCDFSVDRKPIR